MLSILDLQKDLRYCVTNNGLLTKKGKNTTTTKQKIKHRNPCQSRELNPGTLAPQSDALPLDH